MKPLLRSDFVVFILLHVKSLLYCYQYTLLKAHSLGSNNANTCSGFSAFLLLHLIGIMTALASVTYYFNVAVSLCCITLHCLLVSVDSG